METISQQHRKGAFLAILLMFFLPYLSHGQQYFNYQTYVDNPGVLNPAWYPSDPSMSLNTVVRKQWVGMDGAPTTLLLNGHIPLSSIQSSTGLNLSYDHFGPEKIMNLSAFFAKSILLSESEHYLSVSMSIGVGRYEALFSSVDGQDPVFRDDLLETSGAIGIGLMFYIPDKFFAGFSVPQLSLQELGIAGRQNQYDFNTPYYLMMGYLGNMNEVFKIRPAILVTSAKGVQTAIDFSTTFYIQDAIGIGVNYGTSRELGALISIYANQHLRLGYYYQFGTESFGSSNLGNNTHEIGIGYRFGKDVQKKLL